MSDPRTAPSGDAAEDETPSNEELQEPSAEKDPGEEPKAPHKDDGEPSHEAVGIGVIGGDDPEDAGPRG